MYRDMFDINNDEPNIILRLMADDDNSPISENSKIEIDWCSIIFILLLILFSVLGAMLMV